MVDWLPQIGTFEVIHLKIITFYKARNFCNTRTTKKEEKSIFMISSSTVLVHLRPGLL